MIFDAAGFDRKRFSRTFDVCVVGFGPIGMTLARGLAARGRAALKAAAACAAPFTERLAEGVVDADCRVHGIANLYLGGSSVFAAPGFATPTFTIVQLALRLGDHLDRVRLARASAAAAVP